MGDTGASDERPEAEASQETLGHAESTVPRSQSPEQSRAALASEPGNIIRARSAASESVTAESLEKGTLLIVGISIGLLLIFFLICALFEGVRLLLCALQLVVIGLLSVTWEEESFIPSASLSKGRRLRHFFCQFLMIVVPLASGIWLFILGVNAFMPEDAIDDE